MSTHIITYIRRMLRSNVGRFTEYLKVAIVATALSVGIGSVYAAWQAPVSPPTANNPEAPINVGATSQTKTGGIWASFFGTTGGSYFEGDVGIGTSNPNGKFHIDVDHRGDIVNWASDVMWGLGGGKEFTITNDNASINLVGVDESAFSSNITMPEVDPSGDYLDVWAIYRNTSSNSGQESKLTIGYASASDPSYSWWWGQADRLGIFPDGRVVIGDEENPSAKLHVVGDIYATGDITCGGSCAGGGGGGGLPVTDGSDWMDLNVSNTDGYSEIRWADDTDDRLRFYFEDWAGIDDNEVMSLLPIGYVGIGTTNPGYELEVAGDIAYWNGIYDISDARLKENITALTGALPKLEAINGVYFNMKGEMNRGREVGVIAQDVENVLPEAVSEGADGYKRVDYTKLVPLLIEAVKEQQDQIDALEKEVELLKSR